ncbi:MULTISPECIES: AraC family transcriptional regulator [Streptomyces]|uniref:AraC family transcriptional regulator n=1 Tax=Streptomyces TaxID=1883 RepID=UPI00163C53FA|nr:MULTISPECIES: helix-turn-helix transcriptional regulator [Streptomyces]MBC2876610.1 helix-turn-helix transcriptional regulator [Streptomyces sp. TYQ1024]UBI40720.1 helix-turn-helix transcriptional regulator [Streptomyces mobaraensis]UKW33301.1 helix-turn-helix transcriptional regulator [Streptomyces sp. TYQ1024]
MPTTRPRGDERGGHGIRIRHTPHATTGHRPLRAGTEVDAHRHDEHQIVYAGRGVLSVTTDEGSWIAPGNRALWIPAGTVHEHRAYGDTEIHLVGLPLAENPLSLNRPAVIGVGPLLRELILAYTEEPTDPTAASTAAPTAERLRLRAVLLDRLRRSDEQPLHVPAPRDPRLAAVCAVLRDDPADHRTLAQLGAAYGAGERTLTRLFRSELGMSFPQWRTQVRLHHALLLLAEGASVSTVARRCGWASSSAFIDVFRRAFGHTPGAHRTRFPP